jgi:indole-3-glycerol phosphate synthase
MAEIAAPDVLAAIVAAARRIVEVRRQAAPVAGLEREASARERRPGVFRAALAHGETPRIIAECKRRSPSRGVLRHDYDPASIASAYERNGAAAVSVLTEPAFFDGAPEHLKAVRAAVSVPVLRKDFVVDPYQILEARAWGADAVLLIVAALTPADLATLVSEAAALGLEALVEAHDGEELRRALDAGATIVGINNRNLKTLEVSTRTSEQLAARIPPGVIAVAESGLKTPADLARLSAAGFHAFLVGERFMSAADPGAALGELRSCQYG